MKNNSTDEEKEEHDRLIEREARAGMKFSMEQALFMSEGGGLMRGGSPLTPYEQAHHQIMVFLNLQLRDTVMEKSVDDWIGLHRQQFEKDLKNPIQGLLDILEHTLEREGLLLEFTRTVDLHYGQIMQERPYFQQSGELPHPDDAYTITSVRKALNQLAEACRERLWE